MYIAIKKVHENDTIAEYSFGADDTENGKLRIEKRNGVISILESAANDPESRIAAKAIHKLKKHWQANEFPDKTCWAS